jgi:sulfur-oxidizing protein SoxA
MKLGGSMRRRPMLGAGAVATVLAAAAYLGVAPVESQNTRPPAPIATDATASAQPWNRYRGWPQRDYSAYSTLAEIKSPPPPKPDAPRKLAGPIVGDANKGRALAFDRSRGGACLACHIMGPASVNVPGNVGPDLSEIGAAGREDEWLYNYIYDPRVYNPESVMPPWGAHGVFNEEEIGHLVVFLKSLKSKVTFANPIDDPAKRPVPVEDRDNLDALVNPGMWAIDKAKELYAARGPRGGACAGCHANAEERFKAWAAAMPRWEPRLNKVIGVEEFVFRHAKATTGHEWLMETEPNIIMSVYLRHLANGAPIAVDVANGPAKAAAERGKALMDRKIGQLNFACLDCHSPARGALKWIRGQWLGESKGQLPHFPTWRTSRQEIWTIQRRFQWCNVAIQASELAPEAPAYGEIELYLSSLNNGLKLNVPGIRH